MDGEELVAVIVRRYHYRIFSFNHEAYTLGLARIALRSQYDSFNLNYPFATTINYNVPNSPLRDEGTIAKI